MQDPDLQENYIELANTKPSLLLEGEKPRLIDEWQLAPKELMLDIKTFGLLFENLVNRDLSIYANSIGGSLKHYRDRFGLECDNVIHFRNSKYILVEVKLSGAKIKEAVICATFSG